jgi:hypothetical protein
VADYEDPGWGQPIRRCFWFVRPLVHLNFRVLAWGPQGEDGLTALRAIFVSGFVLPLLLLTPGMVQIAPWDGGDERWVPIVVAILGAFHLFLAVRSSHRRMRAEDSRGLALSYRAIFFVSAAYAMTPFLVGVCGVFIGGSLWIALEGLAFTVPALTLVAPTRRNIERRQREIQEAGGTLSLGRALMETPISRN